MAKQPQLPETPDGTQPSDAAPDYVVGYRRPPVHTQFKPGHSKRGGRRKGQRNARTALEGILNEKVTLREGKRTRSVSKRDAFYLRITNDAASGNAKAQSNLITLMRSHGLIEQPEETTSTEPFTTDDPAIIADFLGRGVMSCPRAGCGKSACPENQAGPTQPPQSNEKPDAGDAEPPSKETKETKS